jgi:DNA-binding transcriptional LysR family regulator
MYRLVAAWFGQGGQNPRPHIELNYPPALKSLVAAGHGVALLPSEYPEEHELAGVAVRHLSPQLMRPMSLAHRLSALPNAAVNNVLQALSTFASDKQGRP